MAKQAVIQNPIIKSPFAAPVRHFRFDEDGITDQILEEWRPGAQPFTKGKDEQRSFEDGTADRIDENRVANSSAIGFGPCPRAANRPTDRTLIPVVTKDYLIVHVSET